MLPVLLSCLLVSYSMIYLALLISYSLLSTVKCFVVSTYCSSLRSHKFENKILTSFLLQFYIPKNKDLNSIFFPKCQAHAHIPLIFHINQGKPYDVVDFYPQKVITLIHYLIDEIVFFLDLIDIYVILFCKVPFSSYVEH